MVEFIYEPWKTVVIHEIVQYDLQTFVNLQGIGAQSGQLGRGLSWANGVAFQHLPMLPTEEIIKEQLQGRIHWSQLAFTFMPEHISMITIPDGNVRIPIINLNDNVLFRELTEWIKKQYKQT